MSATLSSIAINVVGQYSDAAHHWVNVWRTGAERRLPSQGARVVARAADQADVAIDRASTRAIGSVQAFDEKTAWANDLIVVNAIRTITLPAAKLSLEVASQVNHASLLLSQRVAGVKANESVSEVLETGAAKSPAKRAKASVKRVRRATAKA
jgi:hypothetical protein